MNWAFFTSLILVGALAGSFLNVVIHRGPAMWGLVDDEDRIGNLAFPRSYCPHCKSPIALIRLIPIAGYFISRGRCANCNGKISPRYPVVEALGILAAVISFGVFGQTFNAVAVTIFLWFLIALGMIDWETGYLPDALTITLLCAGLSVNMIDTLAPLPDALIGSALGYAIFRLIGYAFLKLRGIEGLGQGDAKLLSAFGAWVGWQLLSPIVFIAAVIGLTGFAVAKLRGHDLDRDTEIPFGPALTAAAALVMIISGL